MTRLAVDPSEEVRLVEEALVASVVALSVVEEQAEVGKISTKIYIKKNRGWKPSILCFYVCGVIRKVALGFRVNVVVPRWNCVDGSRIGRCREFRHVGCERIGNDAGCATSCVIAER